MTITSSPVVIPIVAQVLLIIACFLSLSRNNSGYFVGVIELLYGTFGTMFIWLVFFMVMYFLK
jgi:hypothetical protein